MQNTGKFTKKWGGLESSPIFNLNSLLIHNKMPKSKNRRKSKKGSSKKSPISKTKKDHSLKYMIELTENIFAYGVSESAAKEIISTDQFKRLQNGSKVMFIYDNLFGTGIQPFEKLDFESFIIHLGSKERTLSLFCNMFNSYFLSRVAVVFATNEEEEKCAISSIQHNLNTPTNFALIGKLIGGRKKYAIIAPNWIRVGDEVFK